MAEEKENEIEYEMKSIGHAINIEFPKEYLSLYESEYPLKSFKLPEADLEIEQILQNEEYIENKEYIENEVEVMKMMESQQMESPIIKNYFNEEYWEYDPSEYKGIWGERSAESAEIQSISDTPKTPEMYENTPEIYIKTPSNQEEDTYTYDFDHHCAVMGTVPKPQIHYTTQPIMPTTPVKQPRTTCTLRKPKINIKRKHIEGNGGPGAPTQKDNEHIDALLKKHKLRRLSDKMIPKLNGRANQIWSEEEEERLKKWFLIFKDEKFIWKLVSSGMKTRTSKQCKSHSQKKGNKKL